MDELNPLTDLIKQLSRLPGVGPKSAQRLAFFFLSIPKNDVNQFAHVLTTTRQHIKYCKTCFNISMTDTCFICADHRRHTDVLCVVAEPKDVFAIERTGDFKGMYHILGGLISPIDGIQPETLRIKELIERVRSHAFKEVILALNPTIEGDATGLYLHNILDPVGVPISKLAYGLPVGADLDYADEMTIGKALHGRTILKGITSHEA